MTAVSSRSDGALAVPVGAPPRSVWMTGLSDQSRTVQTLRGRDSADVAIIGGGLVGLWTAIHTRQRAPDLRVVVLEAHRCGHGASGRNGGQVHTWWERLAQLTAVCGVDEAVRLARISEDAIAAIRDLDHDLRASGEQGVDWREGGWWWTSTSPRQDDAWTDAVRLVDEAGVAPYRRVDGDELHAVTGSTAHRAGVVEEAAGTVNPGKLVDALRRRALDLGVEVFEDTPVLARSPKGQRGVRLRTPDGDLLADRVVLATGAWSAALPQLRRRLFVIGSNVVATDPSPDAAFAPLATSGAAVCSSEERVIYYQVTPDGRMVFGKGGGRIAPGGAIGTRYDGRGTPEAVADAMHRLFPTTVHDRVVGWSGPVSLTMSRLPIFGRLADDARTAYGLGWSGTGVAQSWIGGQVLASLTLDARDDWATCGLVDQPHHHFPVEPFRSAGGAVVQQLYRAIETRERHGQSTEPLSRLAARLVPRVRPRR